MSDLRHCHPIEHDGISRIGRLIHALRPKTFQIDERSIQDLIVEAHRFAQTLRFYDDANEHADGAYWDKFWEVEILTYLAVLSAKDTDEMLRMYKQLKEQFELSGAARAKPGAKKKISENLYLPLLKFLRLLAVSLEEAYLNLVRIKHPLQTLLLNRIRKENCCDFDELEGALMRLISYHKGADDQLHIDQYKMFFVADNRWGVSGKIEYDAIAAQPVFNLDDLEELFNSFYNTWLVLRTQAQSGFDEELARMELPEDVEYRVVQPHIALFLVFLRLFRYAQDSINELGEKHLDYYYEEILGLKRKGAVPDETYLIFELAKDFNQHFIEEGTPFLAGKDQNGKPLLFEAIENWVVRSAKVADIKTTWIDLDCKSIHARPDVEKLYENGLKKPNETAKSWRSMGDNQHLPDGEVGFAIASPQLILREGVRTIDLNLKLCNEIIQFGLLRKEYFKVFLSSEETWIEPVAIISQGSGLAQGTFSMNFALDSIHIHIELERDAPPVDHLGEELAEEAGFDTRWPIFRLIVNPDLKLPCTSDTDPGLTTVDVYELLRTLMVEEIEIKVHAEGIRENIIFQSDSGVFDGTQKVFPFGPTPEIGNRFYIGSTEVFQKALDSLVVNFEWLAAPVSFEDYYKEYTAVDSEEFATPSPQVLIDFIDRADGQKILLTQMLTSGSLDAPDANGFYNIQLKVSDVNLEGLTGVTVSPGTFSLIPGAEDGLYTLNYPSGSVGSNPQITFNKLGGDFEELITALIENSTVPGLLELVLFPMESFFEALPSSNFPVRGLVKNAYGELVLFNLNLDGTNQPGVQSGNYSVITVNALPNNIKIGKNGYVEVDIDNNTDKSFSIFDAVLRLEIPAVTGTFTYGGEISGNLTDASTDQNPLAKIFVEARDSSGTIMITKSRSGNGIGAYTFPNLTGVKTIAFYYEDNEDHEIEVDAPSTSGDASNFNRKLEPRQVKHLPPGESIVTFHLNVPILPSSTVNINLVINGNQEQDPVDYSVPMVRIIPAGAIVKFSAPDYKDLEFEVGNCSEYYLELLPDYPMGGSDENIGSNASAGNIRINFLNFVPASGALLINGSNADLYFTGNTVRVNRAYNGGSVIISHQGFDEYTINTVNDKEEYDVILNPSLIDASTTVMSDIVKGKVISLGAGDEAIVCVYNGDYYYETKVLGANSEFEFTIPGSTSGYHLAAFHKLTNGDVEFSIYSSNIGAEGNYFLLPLFNTGTSLPDSTRVEGEVRSSIGGIIEDVQVEEVGGSSNIVRTEVDGRFDINISAGSKLRFFHPVYESIDVDSTYEGYDMLITLIPQSALIVVEGKVQDVYKEPLRGVSISISINNSTSEEYKIGTSGADGTYRIGIPVQYADPANTKLHFKREAYEDVELSFPSDTNVTPQSGVNLSFMDIRMRNDEVYYQPLIENDTMKSTFDVQINALNLVRDIRTQEFDRYSPTSKRGFIRFTLEQDDFMHDAYPKMLTWYSLYAAGEIPLIDTDGDGTPNIYLSGSGVTPPIPNPPYAPATNNISLEYTSTQVITGEENNGIDHFYHILPFNGHKEIEIEKFEHCFQLIYPYMPDDTRPVLVQPSGAPAPYATGNLYLGISDLKPGGTLSLLFTMMAGSEKEPEALAPLIHWSYLSADNKWLPFPTGQILKDSTNGLTRTGLIQFQIPPNVEKVNTMLDEAYYWLRAAAVQADTNAGDPETRIQALPSLTGIHAQVIQARFADNENELSHLSKPLPEGTISKLVQSNIAVKKIEQPLESFGGRLPEQLGEAFMFRVSERLRHKGRAITVWDYEHLLMEQFDQVMTAKCIQHTRYKPAEKASERAPGYVTLAVVPDLKIRKGVPWAEPRFTQGALDDMQEYLIGHTNLFVACGDNAEAHLQVVNPLYEKVDVLVKVAFSSSDIAYSKQQLRKALTHYISPWLADPSNPPVFGRVLEKSAILQFIEEQPYVDYVDVGEGENGFIIRKSVTDLVGRPIVFNYTSSLATEDGQAGIAVDVTEVKSRFYEGKICPESERSILIAGHIEVGTLEDVIELPALPVIKVPNDGIRNGGASMISQGYSAAGKENTETGTTKTSSEKAKTTAKGKSKRSSSSTAGSTQKSTSTTKKATTTGKTTSRGKSKRSSSSTTGSTKKSTSTTKKASTTSKRKPKSSTGSRSKSSAGSTRKSSASSTKKRTTTKKTTTKPASGRKRKASAPDKKSSPGKTGTENDSKE